MAAKHSFWFVSVYFSFLFVFYSILNFHVFFLYPILRTHCVRLFDFNANVLPTINYFVLFVIRVCIYILSIYKKRLSSAYSFICVSMMLTAANWHYCVWYLLFLFSLNSIVEPVHRYKWIINNDSQSMAMRSHKCFSMWIETIYAII